MQRGRKENLNFFLWICVFFLILFGGQVVYATQPNTNQVQTNRTNQNNSHVSNNNTLNPTTNKDKMENIIKIVGGSILVTITSLLAVYKFFLEKDYDLEEIEIDLIHKKPVRTNEYTEFVCEKIIKDKKNIEQKNEANPFYLDIFIKLSIPKSRKLLKYIVMKKLIINLEGYKFVCVPKKKQIGGYNKCIVNKNKEICTCKILLKWSEVRDREVRKKLNPIMAFRTPNHMYMYMSWFPHIVLSYIFGFWHPKKPKIEFEKIEHEKGSIRIGIKSKGIFEGRKNNG